MRGRAVLLIAVVAATVPIGEAAQAQFSPQGILGGMTRPFRHMLGHFDRHPRHRHRAAHAAPRAATAAPAGEVSPANAAAPLGRAGPAAWPGAYEEVIGFSLWPADYAARIRGRGFDVIADTITGRFALPHPSARSATTGAAKNDASTEATTRCSDPGQASDNWPSTRLEQILQLTNAEHDSLDKLQAAVNQSANGLRSACQNGGELAAPDRLRALVQMLWTVRDGGMALREPLQRFYASLTETQKSSLTGGPVKTVALSDPKAPAGSPEKQQQVCASENIGSAERMIKEIEMKVRPNKEQAAGLENLHKVSSDMARLLIASCARPVAADPSARLDGADDQLTAMNYAATNVQIALDDFYGKLSRAQKARLDLSNR
ncbi:MAG TPA: Spy/CpxP family protein refolding chaperone [Pseudolabrys sp.]|nr:Spy/CpxP family protein refolding chaperone [Pseudolabrys sp.]